uniref:NTF2-related export protein n=1 Tax=Felis catus TaxID=9685 RepID=A0ABI7W8F0_FELCA
MGLSGPRPVWPSPACPSPVSSAGRLAGRPQPHVLPPASEGSGDGQAPPGPLRSQHWIDASCLTWEGQQFQGKAAIVEKLSSLPFQKIQHSITAQDHQPTPDSCIISMVVGQLKADEDPIMGFHQMFLLKNINDAWVCTNDMFRLALHNFG